MTDWEALNDRQKKVLWAALDLVNGGQDLEKDLYCYSTIAKYVINSTYNEPNGHSRQPAP
jgi:hypothetical protein